MTLGVACAVLMLALAFVKGRAATSATISSPGWPCLLVFPTMMAPPERAARHHGPRRGILLLRSSVGWTVVPIIIGVVTRKTSIQMGFSPSPPRPARYS